MGFIDPASLRRKVHCTSSFALRLLFKAVADWPNAAILILLDPCSFQATQGSAYPATSEPSSKREEPADSNYFPFHLLSAKLDWFVVLLIRDKPSSHTLLPGTANGSFVASGCCSPSSLDNSSTSNDPRRLDFCVRYQVPKAGAACICRLRAVSFRQGGGVSTVGNLATLGL